MSKIKAVIFDMDGVLIDAKDWHYEALNQALELFGYKISRYDHLVTFDGLPTKKKLEMLTIEKGLPKGLHKFINHMKQIYTMEHVYMKCKPLFCHQYALSKLKNEGYMVILISASPEFYIKEFYAIKEVDLIIGTKFIFENGKFVRKMSGNNCKGEEKVKRLEKVLKEKNIKADFKNSYMFSDSLSDKPLLDLVGNPYLINYKKHNKFEILKWK